MISLFLVVIVVVAFHVPFWIATSKAIPRSTFLWWFYFPFQRAKWWYFTMIIVESYALTKWFMVGKISIFQASRSISEEFFYSRLSICENLSENFSTVIHKMVENFPQLVAKSPPYSHTHIKRKCTLKKFNVYIGELQAVSSALILIGKYFSVNALSTCRAVIERDLRDSSEWKIIVRAFERVFACCEHFEWQTSRRRWLRVKMSRLSKEFWDGKKSTENSCHHSTQEKRNYPFIRLKFSLFCTIKSKHIAHERSEGNFHLDVFLSRNQRRQTMKFFTFLSFKLVRVGGKRLHHQKNVYIREWKNEKMRRNLSVPFSSVEIYLLPVKQAYRLPHQKSLNSHWIEEGPRRRNLSSEGIFP